MHLLFRLIKESSVARRTTAVLLPLAVVILLLTIFAAISVTVMSVLRAYVGGESYWSKAQKDAVFSLQRFAVTGAEADYQRFLKKTDLPLGDRRARLEMDKPEPDHAVVREGFLAGGIAEDDISSMVWMYRNFKNVYLFRNAINYWEKGDRYILQLREIGLRLHVLEQSGQRGSLAAVSAVSELQAIDSLLAPVEDGFARSLSEASRQIRSMLLIALFASALLLLFGSTWYLRRSFARSNRLQTQLKQSEERLSLGFEGSNAGLWDWDIVNEQVYYSPWISEQLGYSTAEMSSSPTAFVALVHPDDKEMALEALRRHLVANTMYDVEFRLKTITGEYLWCKSRAQAVRNAEGVAIRMVGSLFDVTDRKLAEAKAFAEKEQAEVTLASIADAVITTDNLGRVSYCNRIAERMLGLSRQDMLMQPFDTVCKIFDEKNHEHVPDFLEQVLWPETGSKITNDLYLLGVDGSNIPIDRSIAPIHSADGNVTGIVIVLHDVSEVRRHAAQLSYQATHDELTGILNRREFERRLSELLAKEPIDVEHEEHAVMYLDLDRFKIINDTCGHAAGDELIRQVSHMLKQRLRDGDMVGRLGGDEFGIVLAHCSKADACRLADVLRQCVADIRFIWGNRTFAIGVSVGLVVLNPGMVSLKEVMKAADAACYMAKEKGRNRIHLFSDDDEDLSVRHNEMEWVSGIKAALDQDRFCLHAQKIMSLHADAPADAEHVEILLRMLDETGKIIPPMSFIPAAERFDLMPQIDRWVIRKSFGALAVLCKDKHAKIDTWAINLSGASIGDDRLLEYIIEQQQVSGIPFSLICFEITETAAIANLQKAVALIGRLRNLGCRFALDDFGVGMSSFNYLKHLPVDYVKIDGSFIKEIVGNPTDRAMVESINQIAHVMGKQTIAEFVENDAIIACLKEIGVDFVQGYGVGRPHPLPAHAFPSRHVERMDALLAGTLKIA
ncbi:EAL domain-containing protein [Undibacterium sp.]|jgi:diguanylate cyclase (GGDEF)-like protein/PAS domain S-box-containing protein|uniref:EAL domain-containing protein n=1 Tax=Undibacterium sp. TaxID=1914977 RepID=UPI002CF5F25B|nr:EAL domain-containing protein [Undibacterium sp.]HTD04686.1 EAL domain-containing protein [Undibacterium sp.]